MQDTSYEWHWLHMDGQWFAIFIVVQVLIISLNNQRAVHVSGKKKLVHMFLHNINIINTHTHRSESQMAIDDNCCMCHVSGVKNLSRLREEDVLHASFKNHVFEVC